jgi:cob(I)alamin adenosyltransferase
MGNRLTRIYTRTGDDGTTGLGDGTRVTKSDPRIEAMGDIDELNCCIGLLLTETLPDDIRACLLDVQHRLFDLGGELSIPGSTLTGENRVTALETVLDRLNAELPPLADFILPGGCAAAAYTHLARATCRRAERRVHTLAGTATVNPVAARYLNRLSDLLFVMARYLNRTAGEPDVLWQHDVNGRSDT